MNSIDEKRKSKSLWWILVKNRLIAQLGIHVFRYEKDKKKRNSKILVSIAVVICLSIMAVYSGGIAYGYGYLGMAELIPGMALFISSLITIFFTMFKAKEELFTFEDYDMVMSLPIPVSTIINSRLINMYLWNTFFALLVMLPMGIVFGYFTSSSFVFYMVWTISIFIVPLIPTIVAAVFGAVITAISSKFRFANAAATILSIGFIVVIMFLSMTTTTVDTGFGKFINPETGDMNVEALASLAPIISDSLNRIYPPTKLFTEGIVNGSMSSYLLFAGVSLVCYGVFVLLLSINYREINTALTSHRTKGNYKVASLQLSSMLTALYKKTILRILKSTVCATNLLVGCVLAIIMSVVMLVQGPQVLLHEFGLKEHMYYIKGSSGYVIAAVVCMTNTAVVSLALEGKNIWIIKSLPIPPKILYNSYLLTNLTFTIPSSVICAVVFSASLKMNISEMILMIITTITFCLFTSVMGIFIGNRMAYYDWQEETQLIKQSLMSVIGLLGGAIFILICGAIANIGILPISTSGTTLILDIFILIITAVMYEKESTRLIKE